MWCATYRFLRSLPATDAATSRVGQWAFARPVRLELSTFSRRRYVPGWPSLGGNGIPYTFSDHRLKVSYMYAFTPSSVTPMALSSP